MTIHHDATMLFQSPVEARAGARIPISIRPRAPFRVDRVDLLTKGYTLIEARVGAYTQTKFPWDTCNLGVSITLLIQMGPVARKIRLKLHGVSAGGKP